MDPIIIPGLIFIGIALFAGGKRRKKKKDDRELRPGPGRTVPTPATNGEGPSDPLPGGTKGGHLPKDEGYDQIIPADMTTEDLWVSPDCQAYVIGSDWYPIAEGIDAYEWFFDYDQGRSYTDAVSEAAERLDTEGYDIGVFPHYSTLDEFTLAALAELGPLCAETMPQWTQYLDPAELAELADDPEAQQELLAEAHGRWEADWEQWEEDYPQMARLYEVIKDEAATGITAQGVNVDRMCLSPGDAGEEYVGDRNMTNAYDDNMPPRFCIGFEP